MAQEEKTGIETDIEWIKNTLNEIKDDFRDFKKDCNGKICGIGEEVSDLKTKQSVSTTKLAMVISGATFAITMAAQAVFDYFFNMTKH